MWRSRLLSRLSKLMFAAPTAARHILIRWISFTTDQAIPAATATRRSASCVSCRLAPAFDAAFYSGTYISIDNQDARSCRVYEWLSGCFILG